MLDPELSPGICYKITKNDNCQIIIHYYSGIKELISNDEKYQEDVLTDYNGRGIKIFDSIMLSTNTNQKRAFLHLTNMKYEPNLSYEYYDNGILFTMTRTNSTTGTYINGIHLIGDINNVKVLVNNIWEKARPHQAWSYFMYLKNKKDTLKFHSNYSTGCNIKDSIELPQLSVEDFQSVYKLMPGICYTIKRDNKNYIIYEKNDEAKTTVPISDHEECQKDFLVDYVGTGIKIYINNEWKEANRSQKIAYIHLTNKVNLSHKYQDDNLGENCIMSRTDYNTGTYINDKYIIGDFNNVKLLIDNIWKNAHPHQAWSFFTYLRQKYKELHFHSEKSRCQELTSTKLPYHMVRGICYTITKNNENIIYKKTDGTQVPIRYLEKT